jgi:shikimate dehydrogenase
MRTFGLIGYPLSHSFSQKYFTEKFERENIRDCEFKNFPLKNINSFPELLKNNPALSGLSVTIPHKQRVVEFMNEMDEVARKTGAVNCIRREGEKLIGFNTDVFGLENSLAPLLKAHHSNALILGTGGGARAVAFVLGKLKMKFLFITRNPKPEIRNSELYSSLTQDLIAEYKLIVNTTPLGMFPGINECPPIPYEHLTEKHLLFDLIYNPEETLFLKKGKERGTQIKNGLEMLHHQAEKAWEIWNR